MMSKVNIDIAREILMGMPASKKMVLANACKRNAILTSYYGLEEMTMAIYKEGWLITMEGCRAKFTVWATDNDGEIKVERKPNENTLHKLYEAYIKTDKVIDLNNIEN